jgi:hypothetical protein
VTLEPAQRDFEQRMRLPAAVAAGLAGVLSLVGAFVGTTIPAPPEVGVLEALTPAFEGQEAAPVSPRIGVLEFEQDHFGTLLTSQALTSLGLLCMAVALLYLFRATDARAVRPVPGVTRYAIYFGPILSAIAGMVFLLVINAQTADLLDSADQSSAAIDDARTGGIIPWVGGFSLAGLFATALALILVALNAMRVGLLTRFLGILGIIVGVFFILGGQAGPLPMVQAVWLIALAPLFLLRWPGGNPPAWERGEAVPWPSQQELREARMAAAAERSGGKGAVAAPAAPEADDAAEPAPAPEPSARKRKRRR